MRAAIYHQPGVPMVLTYTEVPDPMPAAGEHIPRRARSSVVFRKLTNAFRPTGAQIHAGYRSVTGTACLHKSQPSRPCAD